jgi:hypothetical protein
MRLKARARAMARALALTLALAKGMQRKGQQPKIIEIDTYIIVT